MSNTESSPPRLPFGVALLLLAIRGVLLWLLIPLGTIYWLMVWPILRRRQVHLLQLLGWIDVNLVAAIERTILRPLISEPLPWTPASALPRVTHRIRLTDPA